MEQRMEQMQSALNKILENQQKQSDVLSSLQTDVASLKTNVASLQTDVGSLKTEVGSLKTEVGKINFQIGALSEISIRNSL